MNRHLTGLHDGTRASRPASGTNLVPALLLALALVLGAFGADAAVVLTTLHSFGGTNGDGHPQAGIVKGIDGNFYAVTDGGTSNLSSLLRISPSGVVSNFYSFTGGNGSNGPSGPLVQGSDGTFYGTTGLGGTDNYGTVFKISTNRMLTVLYSFTGGNDGQYPDGVIQGSNGNFYGTTIDGGSYTNQYGVRQGSVFKLGTNGVLTNLYSFNGGVNGANPLAQPTQGSDGKFYGTTYGGGSNGWGTVFKITTNGTLTSLHSFGAIANSIGFSLDGASPLGELTQGSDGNFYGTTFAGGSNNWGTVFKITSKGALTSLHTFGAIRNSSGYSLDGGQPSEALVAASDGFFYGTTDAGGAHNYGTVFKIDTNGAFSSLFSFTSLKDGYLPGDLVQGRDGSFYGITAGGGNTNLNNGSGFGTFFRLTIVPQFQPVTINKGTLGLTWNTEAGGAYQLQYNADLSSGNWVNLGNPAIATGSTLSNSVSTTNGPHRFYRLVLAP